MPARAQRNKDNPTPRRITSPHQEKGSGAATKSAVRRNRFPPKRRDQTGTAFSDAVRARKSSAEGYSVRFNVTSHAVALGAFPPNTRISSLGSGWVRFKTGSRLPTKET